MLKLALCEDESIQRSIAAVLLHDYLRDRPAVKGKVFEFSSGPELLESLKTEGRFDQYLLDVDMPNVDGGIVLLEEVLRDRYSCLADCIPDILDMAYGSSLVGCIILGAQ